MSFKVVTKVDIVSLRICCIPSHLEVISKLRKKILLMRLFDFKTCFDSLWLEYTLIDLFFNRIDNECLNMI